MKLFILVLCLIGFAVSVQASFDPKDPNVSAEKTASSNIEAGNKAHETGQIDTNCKHCSHDRNQNSGVLAAAEEVKARTGNGNGSN